MGKKRKRENLGIDEEKRKRKKVRKRKSEDKNTRKKKLEEERGGKGGKEGKGGKKEDTREREAVRGEGKQIHESTGKKSGRHCSELPTLSDPKRRDVTAIPAIGHPFPPRLLSLPLSHLSHPRFTAP